MTPIDPTGPATAVVTRYLDSIVAHDWDSVRACVADDVVRVGPFGDTYTGREAYVGFLEGLMPTLEEYSMRVDRVEASGTLVVAELTETMTIDAKMVATPEALVFDLDDEGRISYISIYIQTPVPRAHWSVT